MHMHVNISEQWPDRSSGASVKGSLSFHFEAQLLAPMEQEVDHVHFHVIPKPSASESEGLVIGWPQQGTSMDDLKRLHEEIKSKL